MMVLLGMMYWVMLRIRALMLRIGIDSFVLLRFELKLALDDYYSVVPVPFAVARIDWEWALELLDVLGLLYPIRRNHLLNQAHLKTFSEHAS